MDKKTKSQVGSLIERFLKFFFVDSFQKTQRLTSDYWELWNKCGLIDYFCRKMRKKYNIPDLNPNNDIRIGFPSIEDESTTVEHFLIWYENFPRKKEFDSELDNTIKQLRLPFSAREKLLSKILYKFSLRESKTLTLNSNILNNFSCYPFPKPEKVSPGFTKEECEVLKEMIIFNWEMMAKRKYKYYDNLDGYDSLSFYNDSDIKQKKIKIKQLKRSIKESLPKYLDKYLKTVRRSIRQLKNPKLKLMIINQAKKYKSVMTDFDFETSKNKNTRQTSEISAMKITLKFDKEIDFESATFRKELERLKRTYPLLAEFLSN